MAKLYNYKRNSDGLIITCYVEEGNFTKTPVSRTGGDIEDDVGVFATPGAKGKYVVPAGITSDGILIVKPQVKEDTKPVIGEIVSKMDGAVPSTSKNSGEYERRRADINFFGIELKMLPIKTGSGTTIDDGDYLEMSTADDQYFAEAVGITPIVLLADVAASSDTVFPALLGAFGIDGAEPET